MIMVLLEVECLEWVEEWECIRKGNKRGMAPLFGLWHNGFIIIKTTMANVEFTKNDIDDNKLVSAIGYLGILCLIPLLLKKNSKYAQYNGKQGLVITIAWVILWIGNIIPLLGQIIWFVGSIALLVLVVMGVMNALQGNVWEMPYLGKYASQIKL